MQIAFFSYLYSKKNNTFMQGVDEFDDKSRGNLMIMGEVV